MAAPELRRGRGGFTAASLRDRFRYSISHLDGMDRTKYAYGVLDQVIQDGTAWNSTQRKAIAEGLRLGMNEGVR